jgi:pimeloyl-ACP methyl ester carboxylesterase
MYNWWQQTFPDGHKTITITDNQGEKVNIAYGEKGRGKPLVLVHGLGMWSYTWCYNIDELAQYFRVICFDAKGYGYSDKPTLPFLIP